MKYLLQLAISIIALFVTYASVYGLGMLFKTIFIPILLAGTAMELGKYVAVSYSYQQWGSLKALEKFAISVFVSILMVFTSVGVFSYLGQGFQNSFAQQSEQALKLETTTAELGRVEARIKELETEAARVPDIVVRNRIALIQELNKEKEPLQTQAASLRAEVQQLKQQTLEAKLHAGPIEYLGTATGLGTQKAATLIIGALTLCLDPFALFMTILLNRLYLLERKQKSRAALGEETEAEASTNEQAPPVEEPAEEVTRQSTEYVVPQVKQITPTVVRSESTLKWPVFPHIAEPSNLTGADKEAALLAREMQNVTPSSYEAAWGDVLEDEGLTQEAKVVPLPEGASRSDLTQATTSSIYPDIRIPSPGLKNIDEYGNVIDP